MCQSDRNAYVPDQIACPTARHAGMRSPAGLHRNEQSLHRSQLAHRALVHLHQLHNSIASDIDDCNASRALASKQGACGGYHQLGSSTRATTANANQKTDKKCTQHTQGVGVSTHMHSPRRRVHAQRRSAASAHEIRTALAWLLQASTSACKQLDAYGSCTIHN